MTVALIVDDNPTNLDVLEQMLKREGVSTYSVLSPRDLETDLAGMGPVDVVFLDLEFPNYDGLDLIHTLREDPRLRTARFIAYTVHISEQNEVRDAGFDGFLGKPLSVEDFPHHLQRILNGEPVWEVGSQY
ncbi:MAG: response regulator [Chloroflexi bacterium]|nr:response regulator [Chloroflexota bacterium]